MNFIDTHTHFYLNEFDSDREETFKRALNSGITHMLLPNIDESSWEPMLTICKQYPTHCFPMAGLHPTSVLPETFEREIILVEQHLNNETFVAIGEIGIDLYWDKTHLAIQEEAFIQQLRLAKLNKLPVAIHVRNSYNEVWRILKKEAGSGLTGVFHCFPGNEIQAKEVVEAGFLLGIGGVVTFKNSIMQKAVQEVGLQHIILETDAPFLSPVPHRGKRNESSYIPIIAQKVADICNVSVAEVAQITSQNAVKLFNLPS